MAKAKKLPSGKWRTLAYDFTDEKGKRHYKSFTADTRKESEYLAAEYTSGRAPKDETEDITVQNAIESYIRSKEKVLSPSTIRAYRSMLMNHFGTIGRKYIRDLDNTTIQIWISSLSDQASPKTVRNVYGLFSSSMEMFLPEFHPKITLPARKRPDLYVPSDKDIEKLLTHISGSELEIAVLLAAFGPMRRGEICALTSDDIRGNIVSINKSMVMGSNREWSIKQPKTYGSYRDIPYPQFVIDKLSGKSGRIIQATPEQITNRFRRAIRYAGLPHFRFHDLRHYAASIMHAIGVPDQYIMGRGGWKSDHTMKTVYRNVIDLEAEKQNRKILEHFESMQHEMQHEN